MKKGARRRESGLKVACYTRIVIDRLRDRYGNSGRERDEIGEREKRKRSRVASHLDKLSLFAAVLP